MARDDRHLEFLNEEGLKYLGEFSDEQIGLEEEVQELQKGLATSHSVLQYLLCTLFSAYLLVRHVQAVHSKIDDTDARDELVKRDCIAYYEISYDHIQPSKDEEEDQYVDRILTDQENKEEKSTVDEDQKPERVEEPKSTSTKTDTVKKVRKEVKRKRKLKAPALNEADSSSKKQK